MVRYESSTARFIEQETKTKTPIMRADVFAFIAPRPKLYLRLLDLPDTFGELQDFLGIDINKEIENNRVVRAGFQHSGVSQNKRLIVRFTTKFGAFWNSYDFAANKGNQSLLPHPLGPEGKNAFKHDGSEMFFTLPNGFQAYYLATSDGKMIPNSAWQILARKKSLPCAVLRMIIFQASNMTSKQQPWLSRVQKKRSTDLWALLPKPTQKQSRWKVNRSKRSL